MPGFDGTGPLGKGPMTGRGHGFCVLKTSSGNSAHLEGFAGIQGNPIVRNNKGYKQIRKEVINMPFGNGTGPAGLGPMTGRAAGFCAGYPVPGYANPVGGKSGFYDRSAPVIRTVGSGPYVYGMPYGGRFNPWLRRGRAFGFGGGVGRGRGRRASRFGRW